MHACDAFMLLCADTYFDSCEGNACMVERALLPYLDIVLLTLRTASLLLNFD